jgi:hypothetical protein
MSSHFPRGQTGIKNPENSHIDLWGKYAIQSINNNQYYLLVVDNTKWYATVEFVKQKSDAA